MHDILNVVRFAQIWRVFLEELGGGSRLHMSLKVHRISSMNTSRKCVCSLQIVYAYLASGGIAPDPHWGSAPWPHCKTSVLQAPFAHPISKPWLCQPDSTRFTVFFTARCTTVQSAVFLSLVVCLSVRLSLRLVDHYHIGGKTWKLIAPKLAQHLRSS